MTNDQTQSEWREKSRPDDRGTGIALFIEENAKEPKKQWFRDVTYEELAAKARKALVFKWVPELVGTFESLKASSCSASKCTKTCVQPGCICDAKAGICR